MTTFTYSVRTLLWAAITAALSLAGNLSAQVVYVDRIGLYDEGGTGEFSGTDGEQESALFGVTLDGLTAGTSARYDAGSRLGQATWMAQPDGTVIRIGLWDAGNPANGEFTLAHQQESVVKFMSQSGYVAGHAQRFETGTGAQFQAAWTHYQGTNTGIGLRTGENAHGNAGFGNVTISGINNSGQAAGEATAYNGTNSIGTDAWFSEANGTTSRIGLYDEPGSPGNYTASSGGRNATVTKINEDGDVIGNSTRYVNDGQIQVGRAAWIRTSAGQTNRLGLLGDGFSGVYDGHEGWEVSNVDFLTDSGITAGTSDRLDGANECGQAGWISLDKTTSQRVGLYDAEGVDGEFTNTDGFQSTVVRAVNEGGMAVGRSSRYVNGTYSGEAAWVRNPTTGASVRVGFTSEEYTTVDTNDPTQADVQNSSFAINTATQKVMLTNSGIVGGQSVRYEGTDNRGQTAWVYTLANGTVQVGLHETSEFSNNSVGTVAYEYSAITHITESGHIAGESERFVGSGGAGKAAWVADATGETQRVGLYTAAHGEEYTSSSGEQLSSMTGVTESGYAFGTSLKYDISGVNLETSWVYNINSDETFAMEIATGTGFYKSVLNGITEGGIGYGFYEVYDETFTFLEKGAFVWTEELGVLVLHEEIAGGIAQYGWSGFLEKNVATDDFLVVGEGTPNTVATSSKGVYLVTLVPEPSSAMLMFFLGGLAAFSRRARRA